MDTKGIQVLLAKDVDGKVVVDSEGAVRYLNAAGEAMLGVRARDLLGKRFPHPLPTEEPRVIDVSLGARLERVAEIRADEIDWGRGVATLATIRDVTDNRRNEFVTMISHELRNPLTTVKMALQSLKEGLVGPLSRQQMHFVDLAHRNVERQARIINNVLDLARLQSGSAKIGRRPTPLAALIEERAQAYELLAPKPRLEFDIPPDLPDLLADSDLITQVLSNLIDNALRFARQRVTVTAEETEATVTVTVGDDGPGLTPVQSRQLFSKFAQLGRPSGSGYRGTGLGLAICKEIVAVHGGRIWIESAPGKGARFRFSLPTAAVASHAV